MAPDKKITKFIASHHVMTLAVSKDNEPYCCNLFYAYDDENAVFIFTSDHSTRHTQCFTQNKHVAGSIVLETKLVGKIQGLQLCGEISQATKEDTHRYIKRYPFTMIADLTLWRFRVDYMKFTDNTLGFGKKLIWQREE